MLVESGNLVSAEKLRKELPKYLRKLRKGGGPVIVLQNAEIVGILVSPKEFAALQDDEVYDLLQERMQQTDTISTEEVRARAHAAIRKAARKR